MRVFTKLLALFALCATLSSVSHAQAKVTLTWNAFTNEPIVAGEYIYYGGAKGVYTNKIDAGIATSLTLTNLLFGNTYHFAATTYSLAGAESALSLDVADQVPYPPAELQAGTLTTKAKQFKLSVLGVANHPYVIQATPDLVHWTNIATVTADANGLLSYTDSTINYPRRFYRTRS